MADLLEIDHLSVSFDTPQGEVQAVRDVSFSLKEGEVLAIVGESGCGKSVLCKSIMKLLPGTAKIKSGHIRVDGADITDYRERDMCALRGRLFSMVFQDPMTSLNPTMTIGAQIAEAVRVHQPRISREELHRRVIELMELVGIDQPRQRWSQYPHQLSGGQRQRSLMAMALAGRPKILLADEPTGALDSKSSAQVMDLFTTLNQEGVTVIMITHDSHVAGFAKRRVDIFDGEISEYKPQEVTL